MKKIKIAQIGTSQFSHGNDVFNTLKLLDDLFEIVGYCLPENEREKFPDRMPVFDGYKELTLQEILNDPEIEAVTIETEEIYLTKYAILAAEHGKHIHCEKPGGTDLCEFEKLVEIAKKNDKVFHFGYMYRYNPYVYEAIERAKSGEFGKITSVEAQMNVLYPNELRKWLSAFDGGVMFFLGCHLIDAILQICGNPKEIIPLSCSTGKDDINTVDFGMAVLKYENGVSFAKVNSTEIGGYARRQIVVTGEKGTIEINPIEQPAEDFMFATTALKREDREIKYYGCYDKDRVKSQVFSRYADMIRAFAEYVNGTKQNPYTLDYELKLYKTLLKACGK